MNVQDYTRFYAAESAMSKVGCAKRETVLYNLPGEDAYAMLPAGMMMHVLMEKDGWAHVIIPRGEITWQTDWYGIYGFVKQVDMIRGVSIADVEWKKEAGY